MKNPASCYQKLKAIALAVAALAPAAATAAPIVLPGPSDTNTVLYGDFYSYSLPILAYQYDKVNGGGTGPGNPYYVVSTPGQIQDDIVVATGASGSPVNTNLFGMNDAYNTPNGTGGLPYFSTGQTALHPGTSGGLSAAADQSTTWNTMLSALTGFLGGGAGGLNSLVFMFNNNEVNSGGGANQSLLVWAQMSLRDLDGVLPTKYFTFANSCTAGGGNVCLSGGVLGGTGGYVVGPGKDPSLYSSSSPDSIYPLAAPGSTPSLSDFVISGGNVCFDAADTLVNCSDPSAVTTFNHNLGANQVAYAVYSPELDAELNNWWNGGLGNGTGYDVMSIDFRLGCNSQFTTTPCTGNQVIDNGFEQLFIVAGQAGTPPSDVPAPPTALLVGIGLVPMIWRLRRR